MAVTALLKLASFTNDLRTIDIARQTLAQMEAMLSQYPLGFGQWLQALAYALSKLSVVRDGYRPFQVVALGSPDGGTAADGVGSIAAVPLRRNRGLVDGHAAAYVCDAPVPGRAFACQAPMMEPEGLQAQLKQR